MKVTELSGSDMMMGIFLVLFAAVITHTTSTLFWPSVEGSVISANAYRYAGKAKYGISIEYEYCYRKRCYKSKNIYAGVSRSERRFNDKETALREIDTLTNSGRVIVFVNPYWQNDSVLLIETVIVESLILFLVFFYVVYGYFFKKPKSA
ncbi:Uncharacterised protein [BD1-7 clade bacterium]|uniref:DUF3592 domain-containing protein n=1 Tax=BD1-7 clade bacterium TaxID=2029982 RepID=A0A5S9Q7T9_9GAMM|nr:Uncharacterised protein [BD1-7 clade bacterium]